jgi:CRP-like cAMP-binding protein
MLSDRTHVNELMSFFHTNGKLVRFSKGEPIGAMNVPEDIFLIEKGHVKVYSINTEGEKFLHIVYRPGEFFPLDRVVRNMQRDSFYEAMDHTLLWRVKPAQFNSFVDSSVPAAKSVLAQVLEQFSVHVDRVSNLEYKRTGERLAYHLLFLAYRFGRRTGDHIVLEATFTQQDIANSINMARESVSREFDKLERAGAVELKRHLIIIKDVECLSRLIGESFDPEIWDLM